MIDAGCLGDEASSVSQSHHTSFLHSLTQFWATNFWGRQCSAFMLAVQCLSQTTHTHTHTHKHFTTLFLGLPWWAGARRNLLLDFMVQGKITEENTPTVRLGASPSGLNSARLHRSPIFMPYALHAATLPIYLGLRQALNMLACIPSGLVVLARQ